MSPSPAPRSIVTVAWKRTPLTDSHVTALAVAGVSGAVLMAYGYINPNREAEQYFKDHDSPMAYRVMEACYIVILAAAAFNLRYVLFDLGGTFLRHSRMELKEIYGLLAKVEIARMLSAVPAALNLGAQVRDDHVTHVSKAYLEGDEEFARHLWWELVFVLSATVMFARSSALWRVYTTWTVLIASWLLRITLTWRGTSAVWQRVASVPAGLAYMVVWGTSLLQAHISMFRDQAMFKTAQATLEVAHESERRLIDMDDRLRSIETTQKVMMANLDNHDARAALFSCPDAPPPVPPVPIPSRPIRK